MTTLEHKIIEALELRPLSDDELAHRLAEHTSSEINAALYQCREQKFWIEKHPIIGGGCKTCACSVTYAWRLTRAGRRELSNVFNDE